MIDTRFVVVIHLTTGPFCVYDRELGREVCQNVSSLDAFNIRDIMNRSTGSGGWDYDKMPGKIQLIRCMREGCPALELREAKDIVDRWIGKMKELQTRSY